MIRGRLLLVVGGAAMWMLAILFRLYDLQVRRHDDYRERAQQQQQRMVVLDPPRGTIYDARGRELAVSVEVQSLAADPSQIEHPSVVAAALAPLLGLDRAKLAAGLDTNRQFVWLARKLDPEKAEEVLALDLPGVFALPESKRFYPLRELASQVLGYVGTDNHGLAGLEYRYEDVVASDPGSRRVVRDARYGTVSRPGGEVSAARPGRDLHLTLDATLQHIVERELDRAMATSGAKQGMVVLMDPRTGAILAMAGRPTFDPNHFGRYPRDTWRNPVVADAFEPGSTFKMVTLAAVLEQNAIDPLAKIDCGMGKIVLHHTRINDHRAFGLLTTREIIAFSSNVGAIKLGAKAGRERFYDTIRKFGFGRPTDIDLPSEGAGIVRGLGEWSPLAPAYISFGQGISVTAIQLTNAFAAVANGGYLLRPYVVAEIGDGRGTLEPWRRREVVQLTVSPSTIDQIRDMLESVVTEGTAKGAAVPGYRVAGKTGTAEKVVSGRGYARNKYIASFAGFAPLSEPAIVGAVILDEPWPLYHGGEVAAPVFSTIARQALLYLGVPPERELPPVPELGVPVAPLPTQWLSRMEPVPDPVATPVGTIPDLVGLSARQALAQTSARRIGLSLNGHGAVRRQLPAPGTPLEEVGSQVEVWLGEGAP